MSSGIENSQPIEDVPGHVNVVPAIDAIVAPKNKKTATAIIPRGILYPSDLWVPEPGRLASLDYTKTR